MAAGDVNHDGPVDLVARTARGSMLPYPGIAGAYFQPASQIGSGWNVFDLMR